MIDVGLLVLRLVLGVIFIGHGAQKLFGSFGGPRISGFAKMLEQLGVKPARPMAILAGLAEFVGGILAILGFLTPLAARALIGVMIVAVLSVHLKNGFFNSNGGDMNAEVSNNKSAYRYELWADGELAGYTQYALLRGRIAFLHTEVYESYEGMGLGGRLARGALEDARARGVVVEPYCPFIAHFIERHLDEYRDLVAPEMLSGDRP